MKIHDISMLLNSDVAEWPGDTPFQFQLNWTKQQSGSVNVGQITTSTHIGTHIDAPFHFNEQGKKVHELPLENYIVDAIVIDVSGQDVISRESLKEVLTGKAKAVLFRTNAWNKRVIFPDEIPVFEVGVVEWMVERGIVLLGVDLPSVDAITSKDLPMHHALGTAGRYILEGLVLDEIKEGTYQLIALPLKIEGADGSPVRAVLVEQVHF
ncbi:arylformamidase [Paenisporosarcina antarctica]|uniref:Kynurenine formamidase n=1 Tax=Paenisporosarcina antarctica TaxID=417367 RepID=A0A4P6ZW31_9BACL|nr:arylformamidase [Paenisporosarcina antarctica]QBP40404.1 arylformamidase [Paenisporosarcina antarctica]